VPSYDYQAAGFAPGETVLANLTDAVTHSATVVVLRATASGAVAGNLTWNLFGFGAVPSDLILSLDGTASHCTASQAVRWP
jgi:hypothetical protein